MNPIIKDIWLTRLAMTIWLLVVIAFFVMLTRAAFSQRYEMAWDHSPSFYSNRVASYLLMWGPTNNTYTSTLSVNSNQTTAWSGDLSIGNWHFAVSAIGVNGLSSDPSAEFIVTNKARPPMGASNLFSRTVARNWSIPPGAILQKSITLTNWMEHIRNLNSNTINIRVSDDIFGRQQYFRLYTNPLPPVPSAASNGKK